MTRLQDLYTQMRRAGNPATPIVEAATECKCSAEFISYVATAIADAAASDHASEQDHSAELSKIVGGLE